jgi:ferrochelatase
MEYDALLLVSFGGPEAKEEVLPFLRNVVRGKQVPEERLLTVAEHYYHLGGRSPINQQNRELIAALEAKLAKNGPQLPVYWGNRNWHPLLPDTLRKMKENGVRRAVAFVTSAYSSYSGCRRYLENIAAAQAAVGAGAPGIDKLRVFYNHPGFIGAMADRVRDALEKFPPDIRERAQVVYTAHSIPLSMAQSCNYVQQLNETRDMISAKLGRTGGRLIFQSRSGPPSQPWLEPDVFDYIREVKGKNLAPAIVIAPIGFISDHVEILYDLDIQAKALCEELQLPMVRAGTVGTHPKFVGMIHELIVERMESPSARAGESSGAIPDFCSADCCPAPQR